MGIGSQGGLKMLKIEALEFDDLLEKEKNNVSDNGFGKEYAVYIKISHNGNVICLESDAMEREDATFSRDLNWIFEMFQKCYDLGKEDAIEEKEN